MQERADGDGSACPFLMPEIGGQLAVYYPAAVYCRLPNGRVRVPPPEQRAYVCSAGHYEDCPGYQRWKVSAGRSESESPTFRDLR